MKKLTCEMCGGADLVKQEGVFVCQSCGSKYSVEDARRMMIEGTVEVAGTVKVDNSAKLDNLYKVARRAKEDVNIDQAFKYYEQIVLEDPNSWEATFYVAYFSAMQKFRANKFGPASDLIINCLDSVFNIIGNIQDLNEQESAVGEVTKKVEAFIDRLHEVFNQKAMQELKHMRSYTGSSEFNSMRAKYEDAEASRAKLLEDIRNSLGRRRKIFKEEVAKRRFNEYWAAHQSEKEAFESERKSLLEQINVLDSEISTTPQKVEGYSTMLELQKKVEGLASEKKALSLFKFKEKKAIQEQIDSVNNEIAPIQSRINVAIEEIQKRISTLQSRMQDIHTELTKPR